MINVLHVANIDNDKSKGTSTIIPEYILMQSTTKEINVFFLNCNNTKIDRLKNNKNIFTISDYNNYLLDKIKPNLVVFHELYIPFYLKLYRELLKKNIPYIIIPHGGMTKKAQNIKRIKKTIANFFLFNNFFKKANIIQYLSIKEQHYTKYTKLNSTVIGNGYSNFPNENLYLKKHKKTKEPITLIYIGRYDLHIKGLDQLLKAMKKIKDNNIKDISLILYGKGDKSNLKKLKNYINKNNLNGIVKLNDSIYGTEKINALTDNSIFIQVSRSEGQPLGVIEALCCGMPVILSYGTGFGKIIKDNSIGICTKTDFNEIYNSILFMKNNIKKFPQYSKKSYQYALENYDWDAILKKTIKNYFEMIQK